MRTILDYVLDEEIGRSERTVVHRARRLPGDEAVAVKLPADDLGPADRGEAEHRLRHEAASLQRVHLGAGSRGSATGVVPLIELIDGGLDGPTAEGPVALVTTLATGTLDQVVCTSGPLTLLRLVELGRVLSHALAAVHRSGVVHGDVSPTNVLVAPDGSPWLADFGASGLDGPPGRAAGTPGFAAPEVQAGSQADQAADVFSLGAVLRFAAHGGAAPITAATPGGSSSSTRGTDGRPTPHGPDLAPVPPGSLIGRPATLLATALDGASHPDPDARPTAETLARALDEVAALLHRPRAGGGGEPARPDTSAGRSLPAGRSGAHGRPTEPRAGWATTASGGPTDGAGPVRMLDATRDFGPGQHPPRPAPTPPGQPSHRRGRLVLVAALVLAGVLAVVATVAGWAQMRSAPASPAHRTAATPSLASTGPPGLSGATVSEPTAPDSAAPDSTASGAAAAGAATAGPSAPGTETRAPACPGEPPEVPAGAVSVSGDVRGQGCDELVVWWPDRAEVDRPEPSGAWTRFALGDPGQQLVLGDWDGDGTDTPGLYDPGTGLIATFDRWAEAGGELGASSVAEAASGGVARVDRRAGGDTVVIDPPPDPPSS